MTRFNKRIRTANFALPRINSTGYGAIGGSVLGGVGGALSADEDASLVDRLGRGALGAGIGAGVGYGAGYGYKKLRNANRKPSFNNNDFNEYGIPLKGRETPLSPGSGGNGYQTITTAPPSNPYNLPSFNNNDFNEYGIPLKGRETPLNINPKNFINGYENIMPRFKPYAANPADIRSASYNQGNVNPIAMSPITPRNYPGVQPKPVQVPEVPPGTGFDPNKKYRTSTAEANIAAKQKELAARKKKEWEVMNSSMNVEGLASFYSNPANYNVANFNWAQSAWNAAKGAGRNIDELAQGIGTRYGNVANAAGSNISRKALGDTLVGAPNFVSDAAQGVSQIGNRLATGGRYAPGLRRALGYGTLGLGAAGVGAAGYAGYNALNGNNQ